MPNIWTHIQFGKEVLSTIRLDKHMNNEQWKTAFQLGCQGPDFLFYDHFLPWQASTLLNKLGSQMHNVHCGPFLLSLFSAVQNRSLKEPKAAYALGFLLHHVLDRNLHPFIFSRSGFKKWHHQRFETAMDSVVLMQRANIHTGKTPVAPEIDTAGQLPDGFAPEFLQIVSIHYPILANQISVEQLDQAVAQFIQAQRLFFDPKGWKGKFTFGQLAPFSPPRTIPDWDVLNETRQAWIDPVDRTVLHHESAMDLWEIALQDAYATVSAAMAWLEAQTNEEAAPLMERFSELLQDISYETGLPCDRGSIIFADSVVPV
ncbi:zinc dependent phospholipase C family protein [Cohnella sp. WQ 127256]|uniref:zinc dependent phospholipase C family protein n=1 Tax=Cohnella sp. WQ 127256 TaxID=2938790 RepID=UPI0021173910|nr:zinc dependent phospholipase C family protein [Cohnella sp. WQ 127256]